MAGMIEQEMAGGAAPADPMGAMPVDPMAADPMAGQGAMMEGDLEEAPDADQDPAFRAALQFAMQALYEGGAAEGVARALEANPSAQALSETAYKMVEVVDERTDANVPEELLAVLAMQILKEVVDIAEAAGIAFKPSEIALAFRDMILRYVEESGYDSTQLRAAMEEVDPAQFDAMAAEEGAAPMPAEGEEMMS